MFTKSLQILSQMVVSLGGLTDCAGLGGANSILEAPSLEKYVARIEIGMYSDHNCDRTKSIYQITAIHKRQGLLWAACLE